jgi:hypothetical protein
VFYCVAHSLTFIPKTIFFLWKKAAALLWFNNYMFEEDCKTAIKSRHLAVHYFNFILCP